MLTSLVLAAALAAPGTWAVARVEGVNVNAGHLAAAQQILQGHLESLGQPFVELTPGDTGPAAAAPAGVTAELRCKLTRIGRKVKVSMRLQPREGPPRAVTLDAGSPEDLDPVLLRLARNLVLGDPIADPRVGEVTDREGEVSTRKAAASYVGVTIAGTFGSAGGSGEALGGLGVYWLYDARSFLADIQAGFGVPQGSSRGGGWTGVTLAALRPFGDRDVTPFVGGGLGFVHLDLDGRAGNGVEIFADAGVLLGRTSSVHFRADLKPFVTTFKLTGKAADGYSYPPQPAASGGGSIAWGAQLALGIGF